MPFKIAGVKFYGGVGKPPIEERVKEIYSRYKSGRIPTWMKPLKSPSLAGCKMHDLCMGETATQRQVLENMQEMAFGLRLEWDGKAPKLLVEWVSPAYERVLGFDAKTAIGENIMNNVHPDDVLAVLEILRDKVQTKEEGIARFRSVTADGSYIWVEGTGTPILNDNGDVVGGVIVSRDITGRVETELELARKSEELFEIFVNSPIAIQIFDESAKLIKINPSCLGLFGLERPSDVIGLDLFSDPNLTNKMKADIKAGKNIRYEVEVDFSKVPYHTCEKGVKHLEIHVGSMTNKDGITGYIAQIVDISKFKNAEKELRATESALREAIGKLEKLLSIVIHDITGPIGSIAEFAKLVISGEYTAGDFMNPIFKSAQRALKLVGQVREWRNAGSITLKPSNFDICTAFDEVIATMQNGKGVKLINDIQKGKMKVHADEQAVGSIIQNLVANAVKFTPKGGVVRLSAVEKNGMIEVSVFDNGVGISHNNLARLFNLDETFTTPGTDGEKGTGLGLTIVRELVEKHGGKIWCYSVPGFGTTFTFTLPLEQA